MLFRSVDGKPLGCDYVSRPEVYPRVHDKLPRSYAIAALLGKGADQPTRKDSARAFLRRAGGSAAGLAEGEGAGPERRHVLLAPQRVHHQLQRDMRLALQLRGDLHLQIGEVAIRRAPREASVT